MSERDQGAHDDGSPDGHLTPRDEGASPAAHAGGPRLVLVDIDGTLIGTDQRAPDSAVRACRGVAAAGHHLFLCTGRSLPQVYPWLWDLGFEGMVGGGGGYVARGPIDGGDAMREVWLDHRVDAATIERVSGLLRGWGAAWIWEGPEALYPSPEFMRGLDDRLRRRPDGTPTPGEDGASAPGEDGASSSADVVADAAAVDDGDDSGDSADSGGEGGARAGGAGSGARADGARSGTTGSAGAAGAGTRPAPAGGGSTWRPVGDWSSFAVRVAPFLRPGLPQSSGKCTFVLPADTPVGLDDVARAVAGAFRVIPGSVESGHGLTGELVPVGVTKASGMEVAAGRLGVARSATVAVGDSDNDLEVIRAAGVGVAMGNARPGVIAAADWVTAPLREDGLARAFAHLGLL